MNKYFSCFGLPGSLVLTALMSLFALVMAILQPTAARLIGFFAMLLSSMGDLFLMRYGSLAQRFPNCFLIGALLFMLSHVTYAGSFSLRILRAGYAFMNPGVWIALLIALVCLVSFGLKSWKSKDLPLAAIYLGFISLHLVAVFSYAWSARLTQPLVLLAALGSLSFLLSDLIIGMGLLLGIKRYDDLIWWLYPIGQILLIAFCGR